MFESIAPTGGMIATAIETVKTYWALGATVLLVVTYLNPGGIGDKMLATVRSYLKPSAGNDAKIALLEAKLDAILDKINPKP